MSKIGFDRRNSVTRASKVIKHLREMGFKEGQEILYEDVEYFIWQDFGADPRTVKKYLKILAMLDYLVPSPGAKPVLEISRMTVTTRNRVSFRDYRTRKGMSHYVFGSRAPLLYQETMNPKYVPPSNPPSNTNDKVKDKKDSQKNMCVLSTPKQDKENSPSEKDREVINNNNNTVSHTHILNTVIDEADKILYAKPHKSPDQGFVKWPKGPPIIPKPWDYELRLLEKDEKRRRNDP